MPGEFGDGGVDLEGAAGAEAWADPSTGLIYACARRLWAHPGGPAPQKLRLGETVVRAAAAV